MSNEFRPTRGRKRKYNMRGLPSPVCPCCGESLFKITASFDKKTYELEMYLLDNAECATCGCLLTAPTPLDAPTDWRILD